MTITEGFVGKASPQGVDLPPGQHLARGFPVLSAGPTPLISTSAWECTVTTTTGHKHVFDWTRLHQLPAEDITVDIHCVTRWSKLGTRWRGVPVEALLADIDDPTAAHVMASSYGGYRTNIPLADLLGGRAWLVFEYDGQALSPEHGGPVRLLVPHLYLWKSAKWITGLTLMATDQPGFWESLGYHRYGDPWLEQRHSRD
ncbi:molybdopterin-dependent oxidoreductase [Nocardioides astragali]|uniref:Molybdopterin-dependent oxidoreductase n=1 Tax=Nocardioides astragali TaxID=1776736 RepID=A0ABW2N5F6_9ACTN|nr:molybdopterin-dependent oxidoreductase [Nocardioides astragali]